MYRPITIKAKCCDKYLACMSKGQFFVGSSSSAVNCQWVMIPDKEGTIQVMSLDNHEKFFNGTELKISVHPNGGHLFVTGKGDEFVRPGAKYKAILGQGCTTGD